MRKNKIPKYAYSKYELIISDDLDKYADIQLNINLALRLKQREKHSRNEFTCSFEEVQAMPYFNKAFENLKDDTDFIMRFIDIIKPITKQKYRICYYDKSDNVIFDDVISPTIKDFLYKASIDIVNRTITFRINPLEYDEYNKFMKEVKNR